MIRLLMLVFFSMLAFKALFSPSPVRCSQTPVPRRLAPQVALPASGHSLPLACSQAERWVE